MAPVLIHLSGIGFAERRLVRRWRFGEQTGLLIRWKPTVGCFDPGKP
jgi:hypothetical protein